MSARPSMGSKAKASRRAALIRRDGKRCQWCGASRGTLTIDHIVPLSHGGSNALTNLQLLCAGCNARKGDS